MQKSTKLEQEDSVQEFSGFHKPAEKPALQQWREFFYDSENGTVMGRNALSWGRIILFYVIFYTVLAALFAIMLWVFHQTLDPRIPKWQTERSLIGANPGMGFRPMPPTSEILSTLITYRGTGPENYKHWKNSLVEFLEVYRKPGLTPGRGQNIYNCDFNHRPPPGKVCDVDVKNWYPCIAENNFNYHKSAPCVFLKLNKIYGWEPQYYNDTQNLPPNMPFSLRKHINDVYAVNGSQPLNTVWVSCEGENPADVENLGEIQYIPGHQGFPGYFYPYENSEGYLSPLLAVHFKRPRTGILIQIECKAWARNIRHSRGEKMGSVHFELMID